MEKRITFYRKPHLEKPDFIAAWPGMGNVALKAANLLRDKLKAEEFAEIEIEKYIRQIRGDIQFEKMLSKGERGPG